MKKELINPPSLGRPLKPTYSQAVKAEGRSMLFISGQVAFDKDNNVVGVGDPTAQTRQTLENMKAVLAAVGATFENIVKVTVYITDMKNFDAIHKVRQEYFSRSPPASTLIQVSKLAHPDLLVEIDAVAVLD